MAFLPERNYIEETLANNYDLSSGLSAFTSSDVSKYITISLQFIYSNTKGDNDFLLEQSNDATNWSNLSEFYSLPIGNGNFIIDKNTFSGKHIRVNFNTTSSGNLTINLIAKR